MNEVIKCLTERRSVRKYQSRQITDEELNAILLAGEYAPSGMAKQSPVLVAVQDPETIRTLEKLNARIIGYEELTPFYGAPTVIVVLTDMKNGLTPYEDGVLAMGNLLNAAHAVGVDSCWVNRAKETFELPEGKALLEKWGIEGEYMGIGNCILGYRDCEYPQPAPRKDNYAIIIR